MMVFDECHNAVKNSPYSKLLRFYHRLSFSQRIPSKAALPQIIGLTASLGVGGKSTEKDAVAHVIRLCAMLNCKAISTVRKNVGELKKFSPEVFDEIHNCGGQNDSNRCLFLGTICELMKIFEAALDLIYRNFSTVSIHFNGFMLFWIKFQKPSLGNHAVKPAQRVSPDKANVADDGKLYRTYTKYEAAPEDKTSQSYLNWVSNHLRRLMPETVFSDESAKTQAIEILEILENLYRAIEMFEDFSSEESFKFLNEQMALKSDSLTSFSRDHWLSLNKGTCETTTKREQLEKLRRYPV
ncbi:hypothetical protein TELCIR_10330 [Teladorsagia circumcincta]|uniref:Helicase ATP-binding domain-containing protein n=1 Tax=Teladorsagia circumcincta TaxID=45464 RepID=A0A2G9UCL0_TELCI|nr:hypothetical protein TELCIR_10330 [Teladorsagia circumcincta]